MAHDPMQFVALARIASSHGVHGRVKLKLFSESLESFKALAPHCVDESGKALPLKITSESAGMPVAAIEGIRNRNEADLLRGTTLGVYRKDLPEADEDSFYYTDLIGLAVQDTHGAPLGHIAAVDNFGAGDIITLTLAAGGEEMLPLNDAFFPEIAIEKGYAVAIMPEILVAGEEEQDAPLPSKKAQKPKNAGHHGG